jgi:hypothetical protein
LKREGWKSWFLPSPKIPSSLRSDLNAAQESLEKVGYKGWGESDRGKREEVKKAL